MRPPRALRAGRIAALGVHTDFGDATLAVTVFVRATRAHEFLADRECKSGHTQKGSLRRSCNDP